MRLGTMLGIGAGLGALYFLVKHKSAPAAAPAAGAAAQPQQSALSPANLLTQAVSAITNLTSPAST